MDIYGFKLWPPNRDLDRSLMTTHLCCPIVFVIKKNPVVLGTQNHVFYYQSGSYTRVNTSYRQDIWSAQRMRSLRPSLTCPSIRSIGAAGLRLWSRLPFGKAGSLKQGGNCTVRRHYCQDTGAFFGLSAALEGER